jgi:hypothetical protein
VRDLDARPHVVEALKGECARLPNSRPLLCPVV